MAIIGSLISGLSSLGSSAISASAAADTNATNLKIAKMNNEKAIQLMREQTKLDQDYNSASAQMQRAMKAGINPMLLAGAQPTSVNAASVPNLDTPVMQNPFEGFDLGGSAMVNAYFQDKQVSNQEKALDIQDVESTIELLRVVGDLAKSQNLTSDDINELVSKFVRPDRQNSIGPLLQDQAIKTRLANGIVSSNLDLDKKRYLMGWLDEMTNTEFMNLLADTENKQTSSLRNRSLVKLDESLRKLNEEKRKQVEQSIANMKEQWKSLNFQGELDAHKLLQVAEMSDAVVRTLVSEAEMAEDDAQAWLWYQIKDIITLRNNSKR